MQIFSAKNINIYCEFLNDSVRRFYILEAGTINGVSDIFYLWLDEIKNPILA